MGYDFRSYELAEHFAQDEDPPLTVQELSELAQLIQDAVENFLDYGRKKVEPPKHG